jgi:hypothetical protein
MKNKLVYLVCDNSSFSLPFDLFDGGELPNLCSKYSLSLQAVKQQFKRKSFYSDKYLIIERVHLD